MPFNTHNRVTVLVCIFCWGLFSTTSKSIAQTKSISFNRLDVTNGLSNNSVLSIAQDSAGFIWLGTKYGLNRYDGRTFKIFKNDPSNKKTISSNDFIKKLEIDSNKRMWVVSDGLDLYHSEDNSFENIISQKENVGRVLKDSKGNLWVGSSSRLQFKAVNSTKIVPIKISQKKLQVSELFEDHQYHIWVGTSDGLFELFFVNQKLQIKRHFSSTFKEDENIGLITTIVQDESLKYWIGTRKNGIYLFDKKTSKLTHFIKNISDKNSLVNNNVRKILRHKNGSLWIGTQDGLSILNPYTHNFINYQHDPVNPNSLSQNSIYDIFQDKSGSVWIGTYFGGVNIVYSVNTPFVVYQNKIDKNSLSSNIISSIVEDQNKNLWIGTEAGGLNYFNRNTNQFTSYKNNINDGKSLSSNLVKAIAIDKNQNIWIGTGLGGLDLFDPKTASFTIFKQNANNKNSLISNNVNCLIVNRQNKLFIGTDVGLNIYDIAQQKFSFFATNGKTFLNKSINALYEDKKGNIWIGGPTGIHIYQNAKLQYKHFRNNSGKQFEHDINCFFEDSMGQMWVGTYHHGLALLNLKNNTFKIFDINNGLSSDNVLAITEDNDTNLWISTDNGLVKYNRGKNSFRSFNILDGLPDNQFNTNSVLNDSEGQIFFGTYNGLVNFNPQRIERNGFPPATILSNLKLFNIPVKIGDESGLLNKDINFTETLTFDHSQNIFTIEFSALNFIKSNKNKYAYMLDGFEKNWNYVDIPSATYTNLPAGDYHFLVKSANNDGIWNTEIKKINIEILPPIWKTWWAYLLYFATVFAITYYIMKFLKARTELKQELHFEKMKLDFFTNVSHEIRTPLTLILGPIEKLEKLTTENTPAKKYALSIKNNTERLYRLVNELLDFRKAESGNMRLYFSEEELVGTLKAIYESFQTLAEAKNIDYTFKSSDSEILVYFDKDQIEKVFFNLLSNAFKFTPNGGAIQLKIALKKQKVKITVTDNGKGIAIHNLDAIFTNFYQADQSFGTGIGLALTKSLIELHKGKISVKSKPASEEKAGKTTFVVELQLGRNHLKEIDITPIPKIENTIIEDVVDPATENFIENQTEENKEKKATILIVEDNDEVRDFIKQSLETNYHVYESENGLEGWKNALQIIPDLIISDVMMPVMDGLELCEKIKTDVRTSHIPVILLTAKSAPVHQVQGLQQGADVYVTKPFNDQILQLNIKNLLSLKATLQKKYSEQILKLPIITTTESSQEEIFLQKLQQIVENNIGNANLDLGFITTEIGMSKSVLYKKFSALTNLSLNEFIKNQRLKHAVELFQNGETSTLTVALQVGFNDVKYFSREFKKMYGITPAEYIKK
ncbi:hybrid sensor histidine kinase/response regulator transcription factor [Flavobacterium mesophilum]|uniref:hybrid sensor histidine kinase/response regulator transcription factor n=1 Tax=Flavobacterium mesophilum TaxID=3143495 RepID=UPI0031D3CBFC